MGREMTALYFYVTGVVIWYHENPKVDPVQRWFEALTAPLFTIPLFIALHAVDQWKKRRG